MYSDITSTWYRVCPYNLLTFDNIYMHWNTQLEIAWCNIYKEIIQSEHRNIHKNKKPIKTRHSKYYKMILNLS